MNRCQWATATELEAQYHDQQWGVPLHDDQQLFEMLILEGAQAGLSWRTILQRRESYRIAFDQFDPVIVANYDTKKLNSLLQDSGIIRNRLKIAATVANAQAFLQVQAEHGSFDHYIWKFVDGTPIQNHWQNHTQIPAYSDISLKMQKELSKRGFKFVGKTICYAYMQAIGMVNDHTVACFRYGELGGGLLV